MSRTVRDEAAYKKIYRKTEVGRAKDYLGRLKKRCRNRGWQFDLDESWLMTKIGYGRCEQTGIPFDFTSKSIRSPWTFSLDRIDPSLGYTKGNTQAVVWAYNAAKGTWSSDDVHFLASCLLGLVPFEQRGKLALLPVSNKARKMRRQQE